LCKYTFAQRRNRLTTHFLEHIPVVKRRISVYAPRNVNKDTDWNEWIQSKVTCSNTATGVIKQESWITWTYLCLGTKCGIRKL